MEIFASVTRPFSHIWEGPGHVSVSVAPVIVAFAWYVGGVTIGAGRYCMGRAPNSNVYVHDSAWMGHADAGVRWHCSFSTKTAVLSRVSLNYLACEESPICAF